MKRYVFILCLLLAACTASPGSKIVEPPTLTTGATPSPLPTEAAPAEPDVCPPGTLVTPTMPAVIPGYTDLDESTGLHMTGEYVEIDLETYRLEVTGKVDNPLSLSYDDLRCMPYQEMAATIICRGYFEDRATWGGVPLSYILELAGVQEGAEQIELKSADGYFATAQLADALDPNNLIIYNWEGEPLPLLHGFPVRAGFPGRAGSYWVKYLVEIVVE